MSDVFETNPKKKQSLVGSTVSKWLRSSHDFLSQARIARFGVFSPKGIGGADSAAIIVGEAVIAGIAVTYTVATLSDEYQEMIRRQLREFDTDLLGQRLYSDGQEIQWIIDASLLLSGFNENGVFGRSDEGLVIGADVGSDDDDDFDDDEAEGEPKDKANNDNDDDEEKYAEKKDPGTQSQGDDDNGMDGDNERRMGDDDSDSDDDNDDNDSDSDDDRNTDDDDNEEDDDDDVMMPPPSAPTNAAPTLQLNNYSTTFTENDYALQTTPTAINVVDTNNTRVDDAEGTLTSVTISISNLQDTGLRVYLRPKAVAL